MLLIDLKKLLTELKDIMCWQSVLVMICSLFNTRIKKVD